MTVRRWYATCLVVTLIVLQACADVSAPPTTPLGASVRRANVSAAWTAKASLLLPRTHMIAAAIGGRIVVADGGPYPNFYSSTEIYDPATNAWTPGASSSLKRAFSSTQSAAINGRLYAVAGNPVGYCTRMLEAYDVATNAWTTLPPAPRERCGGASVAYANKLWVLGGVNTSSTIRPTEIDVYDPGTSTWSTPASMPGYRAGFGAAVLDGKLYVLGGDAVSPGTCTNGVSAYDFASNSWSTVAPMSISRCQTGAAALDGRVYAVGGTDPSGHIYASVESYDPVSNSWRAEPPLSGQRISPGVVALDGILYAVGGYDGTRLVNIVEALTPSRPNQAPTAVAGADQTLECVNGRATASLDGSGSFDPDGRIIAYDWSRDGARFASSATAQLTLPLGSHTLGLKVTDEGGAFADDALTVDVLDTKAPDVRITATNNSLWPPDHRMVHVATVSAADACDVLPTMAVTVSSSESSNGRGDGNTAADYEVRQAPGGLAVYVRVERAGGGSGRTYSVVARATDAARNMGNAEAMYRVQPNSRQR